MSDATNAQLPYGPETPRARRFLVQLAGLGVDARATVVSRYTELGNTRAFIVAETSLGETIERAGRNDARDALAGPLLQLVRRTDAITAAGADDEHDALAGLDPIAEPALAALLALVVADLLPAETIATLYAPFDGVIAR